MTGGEKPGDAKADAVREKFKRNDSALDRAITKVELRDEITSLGVVPQEEVSAVIDQRLLEAQRLEALRKKKESDAPGKVTPLVIVFTMAKKVPPLGAVIIGVCLIAAYVALRWFGK